MRMIYRIHGHPTHARAPAKPSRAPRLTNADIFMIGVTDLTYCGTADYLNESHLTRRQAYLGIFSFSGH
jgi:hypothetical protein